MDKDLERYGNLRYLVGVNGLSGTEQSKEFVDLESKLNEKLEKAEKYDVIIKNDFYKDRTYNFDIMTQQIKQLKEELEIYQNGESYTVRILKSQLEESKYNPKLCPVCLGTKTVSRDFYNKLGSSTSTSNIRCETCYGVGIIESKNEKLQKVIDEIREFLTDENVYMKTRTMVVIKLKSILSKIEVK